MFTDRYQKMLLTIGIYSGNVGDDFAMVVLRTIIAELISYRHLFIHSFISQCFSNCTTPNNSLIETLSARIENILD